MTQSKQALERSPSVVSMTTEVDSVVSSGLATMLQTVCETMGWDYGEAWAAIDEKTLKLSSICHIQVGLSCDRKIDWEHFHACSQEFVLHSGEGLPGRVWATQAPEWMVDVSAESESYFLRHQIAKAFGVKAGLGLPTKMEELEVVLVFFRSEACAVDEQHIQQAVICVAPVQSPSDLTAA
ncbi:MAG TPA: GAF domain-containing protein [Allocoleopsis sp.]